MHELSVGSKVFLLGEYQILQKGRALLLSLEPRFRLLVKKGTGKVQGIHPSSPAGRYASLENGFFKEWDLEFIDPHEGRGGFGASTAQSALVQGFHRGFDNFHSQAQFDFDLRDLHKKYLELAHTGKGLPPSGADFLSQFQGGFVEVDLGLARIEKRSWIQNEWQILFFATGVKVPTHEHLQKVEHLTLDGLERAYLQAHGGLMSGQYQEFLEGFRAYRQELKKQGWEAPTTTEWIREIEKIPKVLAAKGCGAMGADVLAVLVEKSAEKTGEKNDEKTGEKELQRKIADMGLRYMGNLDHRTEGFEWKWIPKVEL